MSHTVTGPYIQIELPSDAVDFEAELVTRVERIGEMRHHFTSNSPRTAITNPLVARKESVCLASSTLPS
jgi:hypothetical protein